MENYIVINGKKAELTDEQLKALGIEVTKKDPFERANKGERYYSVSYDGYVYEHCEDADLIDKQRFDNGDYCTDETLMKQQALHETLNRLLWRESVQAGELDNEWDGQHAHWCIVYNDKTHEFDTSCVTTSHSADIYFPTNESAKNAIKNIVKPFIAQYPDFVF